MFDKSTTLKMVSGSILLLVVLHNYGTIVYWLWSCVSVDIYLLIPQLVELKNGETYNGHLVNCDNWMNIHLRDVICTSRVRWLGKILCGRE